MFWQSTNSRLIKKKEKKFLILKRVMRATLLAWLLLNPLVGWVALF